METKGYKAFNNNLTNRYGIPFEEGKTYTITGELRYGNDGNGFHFCKRLEDTLRYFDPHNIAIAEVTSLGDIIEREDTVYDYYNLYVTNILRIDKVLTREEIISMYLNNSYQFSVKRFVEQFPLTEKEIKQFKKNYYNVEEIIESINYYQEHDKEVYNRKVKQLARKD